MCLSAVYMNEEIPENLVMDKVALISVEGDGELSVIDLFGAKRSIKGTLTSIDLMDNKILIASEA